uniref:Uncharacterized protein n=1 Tax=Triticum urartu TaxID=4572 RepID=A0A8R7U7A1_TRIUA
MAFTAWTRPPPVHSMRGRANLNTISIHLTTYSLHGRPPRSRCYTTSGYYVHQGLI